jgi:hypothetical protein
MVDKSKWRNNSERRTIIVDKVKDLGIGGAQLQAGIGHVKEAVADAVEDGIDTAKQPLSSAAARQFTTPNLMSKNIRSRRSASLSVWDWEAVIVAPLARNGYSSS